MRADARIAAAIDILDMYLGGAPVEQCLTNWARTHRFAGSGDRAAIRDLVFDAIRRQRSYGWLGGAETGRGLMVGALREEGVLLDEVFSGEGYAPSVLTTEERQAGALMEDAPDHVAHDCPDWLWSRFVAAYGSETGPILCALQTRAPVFLRVNTSRATLKEARGLLAEDGIAAQPHALAPTALEVTENARRVRNAQAFRDGLVELQDAASQAVVAEALGYLNGERVLDYCAGGGGKALAIAASGVSDVSAHDANRARMKDLPERARRAGTPIRIVETVRGAFDMVLCDVPCTGSGAWRRQPQGKWHLDDERLQDLTDIQDRILQTAKAHVRSGGCLAYVTCSLLVEENGKRVDAFLAENPDWTCLFRRQWTPLEGGDGFFLAVLKKN